jgi:peptidoglycan/xylan/chitin deacetylase (PgdA/CDA1 family)
MKALAQTLIRNGHRLFFQQELPPALALYSHSLEPEAYPAFRELVHYFCDQDYRFCGPDEFCCAGKERRIFLSFDDNYRSWHEALALLADLGVQATFYVNTLPLSDRAGREVIDDYFDRIHYTGTRRTLSSQELRELDGAGHIIGCHTHSHYVLTSLPASAAQEEILRGKQELEAILGKEVTHFSYPKGMRRHFNEDLRRYCAALGFVTVASAVPTLQHAPQRPLALNRSLWNLDQPLAHNLLNLKIDGRMFITLTDRSPVG